MSKEGTKSAKQLKDERAAQQREQQTKNRLRREQQAARKRILKGVGAAAALVLTAGVAAVLDQTVFKPGLSLPADARRAYTNISGHLSQEGEFTTTGRDIKWFNYTDDQINPTALAQVYQQADTTARTTPPTSIRYGDETIPFRVSPVQTRGRKDTYLFIIPQETPDPSWANTSVQFAAESMVFDGEKSPYDATVVRVMDLANIVPVYPGEPITPQLDATTSIVTEACQTAIQTSPPPKSTENWASHDTFCSSFGVMATFAYIGKQYGDFVPFAQKNTLSMHTGKPATIVQFSQPLFYKMQGLNPIFK